MKVAVVGCGYVGLVSGVGLASLGHEVVGIDADGDRLATLERGVPPFREPGLAEALASTLASGRFRVSGSLADAADADIVLLCVQTPPSPSGAVELRFIQEAASVLAGVLDTGESRRRVVAVRSTVPPGTNEKVVAPLVARPGSTAVVSNPEFLREGSALDDFLDADRVVVGAREEWAGEMMRALYAPLAAPVVVTTPATAELAKYTSNALLATLVSFSNEVARLCEATPGVDVEDVLGIVHRDRRLTARVGDESVPAGIVSYLKAGCGYGGSCLPKDLAALIDYGRSTGEPMQLLEAVQAVNRGQSARLVELAERELGGLEGQTIAVLGAAFKAGTDDLRDSPALRVVDELLARGAAVSVYDPLVEEERLAAVLPPGVVVATSVEAALAGANACLVTTQEPEFRELERLANGGGSTLPLVVDGRRALSPESFSADGYAAIGRRADNGRADAWS